MEGLVWMVLLLSTITIFIKVSAITFCEKSAITVRYVEHCPTDFRSWEIAAKKMKCESIEQRCSDSFNTGRHRFQYHCVINAWMNATLEVCALNRTIFGTE
uniref:Kazal-like domain-containing protein n=1 Tax=Magallana gigas TaxID=29159 RepID=A0A8W8JJW3_MAGGI